MTPKTTARQEKGRTVATSSTGQPATLDEKRAKRLMEITSRPHRRAQSDPGERLKLSTRKLDPRKFK